MLPPPAIRRVLGLCRSLSLLDLLHCPPAMRQMFTERQQPHQRYNLRGASGSIGKLSTDDLAETPAVAGGPSGNHGGRDNEGHVRKKQALGAASVEVSPLHGAVGAGADDEDPRLSHKLRL